MAEIKRTPQEIFKVLRAPFQSDTVLWRVGATTKDKKKGMALAYVDARAVMERLDRAVGPAHWQDEYREVMGRTVCRLGIRYDGDEWIWKEDGAGDTDIEGEKGGLSDALKRAAVKHGIGRYLYNLPAVWCDLDERGRIITAPTLPEWALPKE